MSEDGRPADPPASATPAATLTKKAKGHLWSQVWQIVGIVILLAAIGIAAVFKSAIWDTGYRFVAGLGGSSAASSRPRVLAVFPANSTTTEPILRGLGFEGTDTVVQEGAWDLEKFPEGSSTDATVQALTQRLLLDKNVVLVIGHERSQTAKELIQRVYAAAGHEDNPIPLILPAVTNPDLTVISQSRRAHILRLPATDRMQAEALKQLLADLSTQVKPSPRIALLMDVANRAYSEYLARELVAKGANLSIVDSLGVDLAGHGFSAESLLFAKPNIVAFLGMEVESGIFLRNMVKKNQARPELVFTDGVAGDTFDTISHRVLQEAGGGRVYLTGPFPTSALKGSSVSFPNYSGYGAAAKELADFLIKQAASTGSISRTSVLASIDAISGKSSKTLIFGGIPFRFNGRGDNELGVVHVYEQTPEGTVHSRLCSCTLATAGVR